MEGIAGPSGIKKVGSVQEHSNTRYFNAYLLILINLPDLPLRANKINKLSR